MQFVPTPRQEDILYMLRHRKVTNIAPELTENDPEFARAQQTIFCLTNMKYVILVSQRNRKTTRLNFPMVSRKKVEVLIKNYFSFSTSEVLEIPNFSIGNRLSLFSMNIKNDKPIKTVLTNWCGCHNSINKTQRLGVLYLKRITSTTLCFLEFGVARNCAPHLSPFIFSEYLKIQPTCIGRRQKSC